MWFIAFVTKCTLASIKQQSRISDVIDHY